jgi:hypothetical protein
VFLEITGELVCPTLRLRTNSLFKHGIGPYSHRTHYLSRRYGFVKYVVIIHEISFCYGCIGVCSSGTIGRLGKSERRREIVGWRLQKHIQNGEDNRWR